MLEDTTGNSCSKSGKVAPRKRREFLLRMFPQHSVGVEIGVHVGDFSQRLLDVVKPKKLHLVDPWRYEESAAYAKAWYGGGAKGGQSDLDARYELVLKRFAKEINTGIIVVHRSASAELADTFEDEFFDWVYIDGNHLYEFAKMDLALYSRKTKVGGLITGDDYTDGGWWMGGVKKAVNEFIDSGDVEFVGAKNGQFIIRRIR